MVPPSHFYDFGFFHTWLRFKYIKTYRRTTHQPFHRLIHDALGKPQGSAAIVWSWKYIRNSRALESEMTQRQIHEQKWRNDDYAGLEKCKLCGARSSEEANARLKCMATVHGFQTKTRDRSQVLKRCCMRVKCFIETDAGFDPKVQLLQKFSNPKRPTTSTVTPPLLVFNHHRHLSDLSMFHTLSTSILIHPSLSRVSTIPSQPYA
ncbi:hypothetical protein L2E82_36106 [Cichorium intybus]|uniref:Uncharacterized protein n=1 Tax=Cichorium intybus TaxID=13427 RepID=A0ACB9BQS1_CICIN|nr:hypothetical protein L2E82_36106 [Cichorium intybus]